MMPAQVQFKTADLAMFFYFCRNPVYLISLLKISTISLAVDPADGKTRGGLRRVVAICPRVF